MELADSVFKRKTYDRGKLISYGFQEKEGVFSYSIPIMNEQFCFKIYISEEKIKTDVIDLALGYELNLYHIAAANGAFISKIRLEAEQILQDIANKCFYNEIFKTNQAKELVSFVRGKYGDELEFLWEKFPKNAVWRRKDNKKWYGVILTVSRCKLGFESDEIVEIIDLRYPPEKINILLDKKHFFPGWHMNKKNWFTIILDESVETGEICQLVDKSYQLAIK